MVAAVSAERPVPAAELEVQSLNLPRVREVVRPKQRGPTFAIRSNAPHTSGAVRAASSYRLERRVVRCEADGSYSTILRRGRMGQKFSGCLSLVSPRARPESHVPHLHVAVNPSGADVHLPSHI